MAGNVTRTGTECPEIGNSSAFVFSVTGIELLGKGCGSDV